MKYSFIDKAGGFVADKYALTEHKARFDRGLLISKDLLEDEKYYYMVRESDPIYTIGKKGERDTIYDINLLKEIMICSCPDAEKGIIYCKHAIACLIVREVRVMQGSDQEVESIQNEDDKKEMEILLTRIGTLLSSLHKTSSITGYMKNITFKDQTYKISMEKL